MSVNWGFYPQYFNYDEDGDNGDDGAADASEPNVSLSEEKFQEMDSNLKVI